MSERSDVSHPFAITRENLMLGPILVSDFDGTITRQDFFWLAINHLLPPGTPNFWDHYRDGTLTHFEAMQAYYAAIRTSEQDVLNMLDGIDIDPRFAESIDALRAAGWEICVVSNGCDWYIRRLLARVRVEVPVLTSPSRFVEGQGLLMEQPVDSPFHEPTLGIDKSAVVRHFLQQNRRVIFAGNGLPDAPAARLVTPQCRFGTGDLAELFDREGVAYRPFEWWSEIADALLADRPSP